MKRTILHTFSLTILFAFFLIASIQASVNVRFRHLSSENGLGANYVRCIVQDPRGYLWMGATNGLIRYNGYTAELLVPDSLRNKWLFDERVQSVELWLDRFIWIRLRGWQYSCYDTQTNQFVDYTGENTMGESFRNSQIMSNGELWLSDKEKGCKVIRFDNQHFTCQRKSYSELPQPRKPKLPATITAQLSGKNYELIEDNRGNTIAITESGELWYITKKTGRIIHLSNIYSSELVRLNGKPRFGIVTDKDGIIWISTYGNGLFAYDPQTSETIHFMKQPFNTAPIQTNYLLGIFEDRAGNIWVCQEDMGVACLSKQSLKTDIINYAEASSMDHSNSIHLLSRIDNRIYVGNRYNGLKVADGMLQFAQEIKGYNDDIVAVCQDHAGSVWMGTRQSGIYVDKQNLRHDEDRPESLTGGKISDIECDGQGRIWISFFDGGVDLAVSDGKGGYTFRHFFTGKDAILHPRQLLVDHGGYIWLTSDVGLFVFQPEKLIKDPTAYQRLHVNTEAPESDEVHCIYEDSRHGVVVGTVGRGVAVFDNRNPGHAKLLQTFSTENGLPHNNIQQIIEDDKGYVWVGTDRGIGRYDVKEDRTISLQPANTPLGNMFVENAVCRLDDGRLAFGSRQGIVVIDPNTVSVSKPLFRLRITNFEVNGVSALYYEDGRLINELNSKDGKIKLSYNENSLIFRFSDFEYNEGLTTRYTYRLRGYDKDWSSLSTENFAIYKNLEPGNYIFEVKAQNSNGEWNEAIISLPVIIRPPLWQTWWAYLIYMIIAGIIAFLIYRHVKRIEELRMKIQVENQLTEFKVRFFTNISHEFRTPLTIIKGAMENINALDSVPSKMKQPMSSMNKSVERMMRLVNQLLEFRKMQENRLQLAVEETDIVAFVKDIWLTFSQTADNKRINYVFLPFAHHYTMFVDRNFVDKIAYNLISNAFKYTPNRGSITCRITHSEEERHISIVVEDTGVGIPKEKQKDLFTPFNQSTMSHDSIGMGLHLTHELVMVHHGEIAYRENPHGGSIFTVSLPTDPSVYSEKDFITESVKLLQGKEDTEGGSVPVDYKEMAPNPMNDRHVLIVEDDDEVREFLLRELQKYFICQSAVDGNDALVKISEQKPDLIISDIMMPVMNGIQLTEKIRHDKEIADIPIILLTALSDEKHIVKGLKYGADAYIEKPFSIPVLIAKCRQLIEQRDKLRSHYATETMSNVEPQEIIVNEQDKRFKERLDVWLNSNFHKSNLDVDTFAESMGYGRTTFYKKVKKIMGMTPNDYLKAMRMNKAAELLMDDTMTVAEISYKVGFEDPYYFSKSFKSYFGVSPTQYRRGEKPKHE